MPMPSQLMSELLTRFCRGACIQAMAGAKSRPPAKKTSHSRGLRHFGGANAVSHIAPKTRARPMPHAEGPAKNEPMSIYPLLAKLAEFG